MRILSPQSYTLGAILSIVSCTGEILDGPGLGQGGESSGGSPLGWGGKGPGGSTNTGGTAGRTQGTGTVQAGSPFAAAGSFTAGPSAGSGGRPTFGQGGTAGNPFGSPNGQAGSSAPPSAGAPTAPGFPAKGGSSNFGNGGSNSGTAGSGFGFGGKTFGFAGMPNQGIGGSIFGMGGKSSGMGGSPPGMAGSPSGVAGSPLGMPGNPPATGGPTSTCTEAQGQVCNNQIGKHCGYTFEYWKDNGTGCMTNKPDGFSVEWNNINNLLGRKGVRPGTADNVVTYEANYQPNGNSYLCVYGWTRGPLIEYYIVDSWGTWRPPGGQGFMGTLESDGGTYDIYRTQRTNAPSIDGNQTFYQYYSVRQQKRTSGTITVGNHFKAWASKGMNIGSLYEVSMTVEGYQSSGKADVKLSIR